MIKEISNKETVKSLVQEALTTDIYYKKLTALMNDVEFFIMYMDRNRKSDFRFNLRISCGMSYRAFNDIWKKYGYYYDKETIETIFAEFMLLKLIIEDLDNDNEETRKYTNEEVKVFIDYFERYKETFIKDYINDFIGCSLAVSEIREKVDQINVKEVF